MKWISVKNVLPKDGIKVLTYSETTNKYGFCDCLKSYVLEYGNYDKVTHWAKLEPFGNSEQLVRTSDILIRKPQKEKCKNYTKGKGYGYCSGVKEFDMCFCNGDKSKCDFYDEIKKENLPQKYEVVIADDNIFVICPIAYDEKEKSDVVKYGKAEIYANQSSINTLEELRFEKCKY